MLYEDDHRYFVNLIREEQTALLGTHWLKEESKRNPYAKWAMDEMKRAAIKVVRWCQASSPESETANP